MWPSKTIESAVAKVFQKAVKNDFSGVVLVRHRGDILLYEAAGMANRESNAPNTVDTVFNVESITKQYTASLIMALQEAGLLTVDDSLSDHFKDLPKDKADITIHQLLTHTSGFRRGFGGDTVAINREIFLSLAWATRLDYEPGTKYQYSNAGYSIAAAIAEIVSGESYEVALKRYILGPSKLNETGYVLPDWSSHTLAIGYKKLSSFGEMSSWLPTDIPYWNLIGNGGLLTTASDLLKWHDVLSGESVLSNNSVTALQSKHVDMAYGSGNNDQMGNDFYGYGWRTETDPSIGVMHHHSGSNGYFKSFIGRAIDKDLVIIVLANEFNGVPEQLVDDLGTAVIRSK